MKLNIEDTTFSPLAKYANCCVEIICMNQSVCRNLFKYTWKQPSFELDL